MFTMKKDWFILSNKLDVRIMEKFDEEALNAIKYAAETCQIFEKQLCACHPHLMKIFGNKDNGVTPINKSNLLERLDQLLSFLRKKYTLFRNETDFKEAMKTQHNLGGRLNTMDKIFAECYGLNMPAGYCTPSYMVRLVLIENEKRCKDEGIDRPPRIHPSGKPGKTIWTRNAVIKWFELGGYFKNSKDQIKWLSWARGFENIKCEICENTSAIELHHKDFDHFNNIYTNHAIVCRSCHKNLHDAEAEHIIPPFK
jgi:hypothetical protein